MGIVVFMELFMIIVALMREQSSKISKRNGSIEIAIFFGFRLYCVILIHPLTVERVKIGFIGLSRKTDHSSTVVTNHVKVFSELWPEKLINQTNLFQSAL